MLCSMELDIVTTSVPEYDAIEADSVTDIADLEAETCGLCMEVVIDRGLLDCCQHWFCFACIDNWATITNLCPLCQNEFQLITCVPVYDTVGSDKFEEESFAREDDWSVEGKNNTLSFPSYYIDENAVVCLDGSGCKVRTGSATVEGETCLDTSIACDSCDIWYHAFCVGFDTEGTSEDTWLCPRCTGQTPGDSHANHSEAGNSSSQENVITSVENSFGHKLSISVADAGETAIVVSMVTGDHSCKGSNPIPCPTIEDNQNKAETIHVTSEFQGDITGKPMLQNRMLPKLEPEDLELSFPRDASPSFPSFSDASEKSSLGNSSADFHLGSDVCSSTCVDDVKEIGTDIRAGVEIPQIISEDTLVEDERATFGTQNTVCKTNSSKRRRADPSYVNEELRAKSKTKVKPRHAKRSKPEGKASPEKYGTLVTGDDILRQDRETSPDIMSIVKGTEAKPSRSSKLRVKKIMRRSMEDKESFVVVQNLRKEIREAVRNRSADELGENLFDPKLLAAFRAVVTGPKAEPVTKLTPSAIKARKSLLQKGKVRESLTKKIYGTSNGRRKRAWDRDYEVEFWKYRCSRTMRPEKIETLKSVLGLLRNASEGSGTNKDSENGSANSILSRLYIADTSVLPRKDDIKPLSNREDATNPEQKKAQVISAAKSSESRGSNISTSAANVHGNNTSLVKVATSKRIEGSLVSSLGNPKGSANNKKETPEKGDDVKTDRRKWALELLARKTASAGTSSARDADNAVLKGNYPLLAQLPIDMWPTLAPSRHKKIPLSVRQTQLYHLTEHLLKKANLSSLCRNAGTELAVADAINIEKAAADRSSSKLVYVNICSQELSHRSDNTQSDNICPSSDPPSPLQAAPTEKSQEQVIDKLSQSEAEAALRATGLLSDSPPGSPHSDDENEPSADMREKELEDILELGPELDIYGDFEYDLGDEDYVGASAIKVSMPQPEEGESKMKVVFSTFVAERSTGALEATGSELIENQYSSLQKIAASKETLIVDDASEKPCETEKLSPGEGDEEPSAAECEELYGPEEEPYTNKYSDGIAENGIAGCCKSSGLDKAVKQSGGQSIHESADATESRGDSQSQINRNEGEDEEKANTDGNKQSNGIDSVTKKVEAYIKEHIRPLCKSGVISPEQYRWAVSKTTEKVMRYHSTAKNANFLIKEGEKVKRLAEGYVEAAQKRKSDL